MARCACYDRGVKATQNVPFGKPWDAGLSDREREVARRVIDGGTNRAIAEELQISEKTVEKHLSRIFRKLGFTSRAQLAVFVVRAERAEGRS
jgi:DNA-binding NarL/FixJ family response regulator